MGDQVEIRVASDTRWLALIRRVTDEFCQQAGIEAQERHAVILAVDEAASNVIRHAYKGDPAQELVLTWRWIEGGIEIEIRDQGEPFDPREKVIPPPDEMRLSGRGLYLMRTIMDQIEYRREGSTNLVCMRKMIKTSVKN
jgi:serine/threonine-protein kinase RsbW